ncbi:MAG: hypothetical protein HC803_11010 [Saprospiraceae bacterium]|nr:hypothetical protein [Saprospiraceae bacterium]
MSVVFGWYSFKIKSFKADELNLDKEKWGDSKFEVHQEVFHLFWIPVLGVRKLYRLRKNGVLLELPTVAYPMIIAKKLERLGMLIFCQSL